MSKKYHVLIVEDEKPAQRLLLNYLENHSQVEVVGVCNDGLEGAKMIHEKNPHLIFLDIQMPKINGFEMLDIIEPEKMPLVIFSTAYDEYALQSYEFDTCDYLLKPISKERFDKAIHKALDRLNSQVNIASQMNELLKKNQDKDEPIQRVVVRSGHDIAVLLSDDILCIEASDDYVIFHTEKEQHVKKQTLKFYENKLDNEQFLRVHRSFIIRINALSRIEPYSKDAFSGLMTNGTKVSISKSGYDKLKGLLNF